MRQAQLASLGLWIAASLLIAGWVLMFLAPQAALGVDLGLVGGTLLPVGVLLGLICLAQSPARPDSIATYAEKRAIISLVIVLLAGGYLLYVFVTTGWDAYGREVSRTMMWVIALLIVGSVLQGALAKREGAEAIEDERDDMIRRRAASGAHTVLLAALVAFAVAIGLPGPLLTLPTPAAIANALILMVVSCEAVRYFIEVWLHRRERA